MGVPGTLKHCAVVTWYTLWKTVWQFPIKLNIWLPYEGAISLVGISCERKMLCSHTYFYINIFTASLFRTAQIRNSLKAIDKRIHKPSVIYSCNRIFLSNEKEQNPPYAQCRHLPKTSINKKVHKVWFHLYEIKEQPKLIYNERKQICSCLGPGGWELTSKEYEGTFGGDENISWLGWQLQGRIHLSKLTDHTLKMGGFYWTKLYPGAAGQLSR